MGIRFSCPECQFKLNVKEKLAGKRAFCPNCRETLQIPDLVESGKSATQKAKPRSNSKTKTPASKSSAERRKKVATKVPVVDAQKEASDFANTVQQRELQKKSVPTKESSAKVDLDSKAAFENNGSGSLVSDKIQEVAQQNAAPDGSKSVPGNGLVGEQKPVEPISTEQMFHEVSTDNPTQSNTNNPPTNNPSSNNHVGKQPPVEQRRDVQVRTETPTADNVPDSDPLAGAEDSVWYVRPPSGGQFGPASASLMRQWLSEERVGANSLVWRNGWKDWSVAHQVFPQLLSGHISAAPGTPSATPAQNQQQSFVAQNPATPNEAGADPFGNGQTSEANRKKIDYYRRRRRKATMGILLLFGGIFVISILIIVLAVVLMNQ